MSEQQSSTKRRILESYINKEKDFIEDVVIPLFNKMGYKVLDNQGALEMGKDLILVKQNDFGSEVIAVVVKAKNITNTSAGKKDKETLNDVKRQITQSWTMPIKKDDVKNEIPNIVFAVTCGSISNTAEEQIQSAVESYNKSNTKFFDRDRLIPLIDKFYPELWIYETPALSTYLNNVCAWVEKKTLYESSTEKELNSIGITCVRRLGDDKLEKKSISDPVSVIQTSQTAWFQGGSGSGKTFSVWHLSKGLLKELKKGQKKGVTKEHKVPIIINSKALPSLAQIDQQTFTAWLVTRANEIGAIPSLNDLELWCKTHGLVIFIDELELNKDAESLNKIYALLENSKFKYSLILSSRYFSIASLKLNFKTDVWYMRDINLSAATRIIKVAADKTGSQSAYKELVSDGVLSKIPRTPLALNAIRIIFSKENSQTPNNAYEFFDLLLGIILGRWEANRETTKPFDYNQVRVFLERTAYKMVSENKTEIDIDELEEFAKQILESVAEKTISPRAYIERLIEIGNVCTIENGKFSFLQRTFQEFLAGSYIFKHKWNHQELLEKLTDVYWEDAIIFAAGGKSEDDEFLKLLPTVKSSNHYELFQKMKNIGLVSQALYHSKNDAKAIAIMEGAKSAVKLTDDEELKKRLKQIAPNLPEVYRVYMTLKLYNVFYGKLTLLSCLEELAENNLQGREGYYLLAALFAQGERIGTDRISSFVQKLKPVLGSPEDNAIGGFISLEAQSSKSNTVQKVLSSKKIKRLATKTKDAILLEKPKNRHIPKDLRKL